MTPEERWTKLIVRIENEMLKVDGKKNNMEEWVMAEAMMAAFNRVQQIMKELEEK